MLTMLILTLRTDKPQAELGLFEDGRQLAYVNWQAHRQLAETIHQKLQDLLSSQDKRLSDLQGLIAYRGPGSFTGLRIGLSVANALAVSLNLPIVGSTGEQWIEAGRQKLLVVGNQIVTPEYGAPVRTTKPKK
jgi:tRNA threonylcarbamoyladenosine biosynthesis protein TsaB